MPCNFSSRSAFFRESTVLKLGFCMLSCNACSGWYHLLPGERLDEVSSLLTSAGGVGWP